MRSLLIGRVHLTEGIFPSLWPYRLRRLGHQPFTLENPDRHRVGSPYGAVAQLGAQFPCKEKVVGSSPIGSTIDLGFAAILRES